ncbi:hypothetical protein PAXRUDRAFT_836408, partial [Paxillus rubicundulus Ve08.2h10]
MRQRKFRTHSPARNFETFHSVSFCISSNAVENGAPGIATFLRASPSGLFVVRSNVVRRVCTSVTYLLGIRLRSIFPSTWLEL